MEVDRESSAHVFNPPFLLRSGHLGHPGCEATLAAKIVSKLPVWSWCVGLDICKGLFPLAARDAVILRHTKGGRIQEMVPYAIPHLSREIEEERK